jgi:D-arabinose 1-dehydrogenase-like Zn-dependent alcohol dehydrogenase
MCEIFLPSCLSSCPKCNEILKIGRVALRGHARNALTTICILYTTIKFEYRYLHDTKECPVKSLEYILVAPQTLALVENKLEWPPVSGDGILCETIMSGISPGTELAAWNGENPLRPSGGYPRKIGYQNISKVIAISGGNGRVQIGDQVYTNQSHCSQFSCNEEEVLAIVPKTKNIKDYIFAYMYHMSLCALSVDKKVSSAEEIRIAVFGGGALGSAIVEAANTLGHSVLQISDSMQVSNLDSTKKQIVSREEFKDRYKNSLPEFHHCIVTTNRWDDYDSSLSTSRPKGTIVLLGFPGRGGSLPSRNPFEPKYFYLNNLVIRSLPSERIDSLALFDRNLSLFESMTDIVARISQGILGQTFSSTKVLEYVDLENAYIELSKSRKTHVSLAIKWS